MAKSMVEDLLRMFREYQEVVLFNEIAVSLKDYESLKKLFESVTEVTEGAREIGGILIAKSEYAPEGWGVLLKTGQVVGSIKIENGDIILFKKGSGI